MQEQHFGGLRLHKTLSLPSRRQQKEASLNPPPSAASPRLLRHLPPGGMQTCAQGEP